MFVILASKKVPDYTVALPQIRSMAFVSPPTYQLTYGDLNNQYSGPVTVSLDQYV